MFKGKSLFCFGYGYCCDYLGHALLARRACSVSGTTRDPGRRDVLRGRGVRAEIFEADQPLADISHLLKDVTHLLISTPPGDDGDPSFLVHGQDIAALPALEWVGYLSTTSVYGTRDGNWVDETTAPRPSSQRGSRRLKAEEQWLSLHKSHGLPVHIFRLAGIYGPGRSALDSLRAGLAQRIFKKDQFFGRIHVEDIVNVLLASMARPMPGEVFNVIDDLPAPSHEVIEYACDLLKRPPPPMVNFEDADLSPMTRSFYSDNRRTSNQKIKDVLGVDLLYPDYKAGLVACLDAEEQAQASAGQKPSVFSS